MHSVRRITICKRVFSALLISIILTGSLKAQENSPYSRYGLGDLLPSQNIINRAMGGLSVPYADLQSVNFVNPASYASLKVTTLDIGIDYSSRTLRTVTPPRKFKSSYLIPSYLQIGIPLSKKGNWGMNIGIRSLTRINYNLESRGRLAGIDSVFYNYTGNGGTYQAYIGTGFGTKNLHIGFNVGYLFGNKEYGTRLAFVNDSVIYKKTNSSDTTRFGGLFVNAGIQYKISLGNRTNLRLGLTGSLQHKLNARRDITRETYEDGVTGPIVVDSIYRESEQKGEIVYPASYGFGILFDKEEKWLFGAEYNTTKWTDYRYYGEADPLRDSWTLRIGGQIIPNLTGKNYWSRVVYRIGFSYGADYIDIGQDLNQYLFSAGMGLPVRRTNYSNQYTTINLTVEGGARGNKSNAIREGLFKVSVGLNLSDIWFFKRKYD